MQFDAFVKGHDDIGPEGALDFHRALGAEHGGLATLAKGKGHALFGDFTIFEAKYLKATGVGEDGFVPAHEVMQAAVPLYQGNALFIAHVVGVGQHHLGAGVGELIGQNALHRGLGATGIEAGVSTTPCAVVKRPRRASPS